jgi:flagellum-specific peptidoglycan hydrolase FlgJ
MTQAQKTFIERIGNAARADMARSGVLASMKIAQTIIESAWGTADLWEHSIADHAELVMTSAKYAHILGITDYIEACRAIHAAGYSSDPDYSNKLIKLIQLYDLDKYDRVGQ